MNHILPIQLAQRHEKGQCKMRIALLATTHHPPGTPRIRPSFLRGVFEAPRQKIIQPKVRHAKKEWGAQLQRGGRGGASGDFNVRSCSIRSEENTHNIFFRGASR